jgi:hypothetical protein
VRGRQSVWRQRAGLLTVAGLLLLANLGFLIGSRSIRMARKQALEERRASLTAEVAAKEAEARKLMDQKDRLARVSSVIEDFYGRRVGSRRATLAPIVDEVHSVIRKIGVAPTSIGYSSSVVKGLPLSQMTINFSFKSDYARFKRLLYAFEMNPRWIVVREVALSRDAEGSGEVQVHLVLGTYFTTEEKSPLPAAVAPPPVASTRRTARVERTVQR